MNKIFRFKIKHKYCQERQPKGTYTYSASYKRLPSNFPEPEPGDRVLWICFNGFGDALESAADACNFKKLFPNVHLTFLTHPEYESIFQSQPFIDAVITGHRKPAKKWLEILKKIRNGNYKWLISYQHGGHSAFLAAFSRIPHRIGVCCLSFNLLNYVYHASLEAWLIFYENIYKDAIIKNAITSRTTQLIFASEDSLNAARVLLKNLPKRRIFAIIGAGNFEKKWPAKMWIELLRPYAYSKYNNQDNEWGIVLNGYGPEEENIAKEIENAIMSPNLLNLTGSLDFKKMAGVASLCTVAIGNDTGPLHLAALCGVPTMGIANFPILLTWGLSMSWAREICAINYPDDIDRKAEIPLKSLPSAPVSKAFAEFLRDMKISKNK